MSIYADYPEWLGIKTGVIIFTEADWPTTIGFKWGTFVTGAGTVLRDADHGVRGTGAVALSTGILSNDVSEIKHTSPYYVGNGRVALELKWANNVPAFGASTFDFGIEPRQVVSGFLQGRMRYTVSGDEWTYESGTDVYTSFSDPVIVPRPTTDTAAGGAGDQYGWARLVIDIAKQEYVSFQAAAKGTTEYRDMTGIPLVNRGVTTDDVLLFFALNETGGAATELNYTTDWAATVSPT